MLFGVDVVWIGTVLAFIAAGLVIAVIYLALTIRDPMQKRVKALNERREELKAGIMSAGPKKRAQLVRRSETTDRIRGILNRLNGLQDSQINEASQRLAQAGIRNKELAVVVILARLVAPIVLGALAAAVIYWANYFPPGPISRSSWALPPPWAWATKAPTSTSATSSTSAPPPSARGCPMRSTCW
jgi:tight adherence protein C